MGENIEEKKIVLSIIIVNYNSGNLLEKTVKSIIKNILDLRYEIIIVDNSSTDFSLLFLDYFKAISVYKLDDNIGFAAANNFGVEKSKGIYYYFLNPDATIFDQNTSLLIRDFKRDKNIGIVAPEVLNSDCSLQYSARKFPNLRRLFFYTYGISKLIRTTYTCDYKMEFVDHSKAIYPDWVSGAAFIIPKYLFEKIKGFDEAFFLFYEDIDICKRVRQLGYEIKYNPNVKVKHLWGGSSLHVKEFAQKEDYKSRFIYFKKHSAPRYLACIKLLTFLNIILRSITFLIIGRFNSSYVYFKTLKVFINEKR